MFLNSRTFILTSSPDKFISSLKEKRDEFFLYAFGSDSIFAYYA